MYRSFVVIKGVYEANRPLVTQMEILQMEQISSVLFGLSALYVEFQKSNLNISNIQLSTICMKQTGIDLFQAQKWFLPDVD